MTTPAPPLFPAGPRPSEVLCAACWCCGQVQYRTARQGQPVLWRCEPCDVTWEAAGAPAEPERKAAP